MNFTLPKLVSEKGYDKIIVTVDKEILSEHATRLTEDSLVFVDSESFDKEFRLKVP